VCLGLVKQQQSLAVDWSADVDTLGH
jgi:hypothetical protein